MAPSPDILENLKSIRIQIDDKEHEVAARKTEKQQVIDQFQLDLERIKLALRPALGRAEGRDDAGRGDIEERSTGRQRDREESGCKLITARQGTPRRK